MPAYAGSFFILYRMNRLPIPSLQENWAVTFVAQQEPNLLSSSTPCFFNLYDRLRNSTASIAVGQYIISGNQVQVNVDMSTGEYDYLKPGQYDVTMSISSSGAEVWYGRFQLYSDYNNFFINSGSFTGSIQGQ